MFFLLITGQLELRLGFGLVLVLICGITTADRLPYVVSIDYKNMMWCSFTLDPDSTGIVHAAVIFSVPHDVSKK